MNNETTIKLQQELINLYEQQIMDLPIMSKIEYNKINEAGYNEATKFGPSENNPPIYSIPLYENGIKTEWTIDGVVGDEKYKKLVSLEGKLPELVNVTTKKIN